MSKVFNDTTNLLGLVQLYEREIGADQGDVSGTTALLKEFTADTKGAFDRFWQIALPASGTWQFDDNNQTDYPIITTNLVLNQRDYSFTTDGSGNLILDIYKVLVKDASGVYSEIDPIDVNAPDSDTSTFTDGQNSTGTPTRYDKLANGIFLDPIPSYNSTNGLKVYINREASYFVSGDTTKKPGVPGIFHDYFYLWPALQHARRNNHANHDRILSEVLRMEHAIETHFSERPRDERRRMTITREDNR